MLVPFNIGIKTDAAIPAFFEKLDAVMIASKPLGFMVPSSFEMDTWHSCPLLEFIARKQNQPFAGATTSFSIYPLTGDGKEMFMYSLKNGIPIPAR